MSRLSPKHTRAQRRGSLPYLRLGLFVGAVLRVEEEGDVGHEGRHHLSQVQFWDLIGLELFLVVELCQVLLKRLAEVEGGAHLPGIALVGNKSSWNPLPRGKQNRPPGASELVRSLHAHPVPRHLKPTRPTHSPSIFLARA